AGHNHIAIDNLIRTHFIKSENDTRALRATNFVHKDKRDGNVYAIKVRRMSELSRTL
ncbi:MAG: hypothetical protein ACI8RD_013289, partial [Bacillariaceae sp.]